MAAVFASCDETAFASGPQGDSTHAGASQTPPPAKQHVREGLRAVREIAEQLLHWADKCQDQVFKGDAGYNKSIGALLEEMFESVRVERILQIMPPARLQKAVAFGQRRLQSECLQRGIVLQSHNLFA